MGERDKPASQEAADLSRGIEKMATERPEAFREITTLMGVASVGNPLYGKMTSEHITKVLEQTEEHDKRQFEFESKQQDYEFQEGEAARRYYFVVFALTLVVVLVIVFLFRDQPEVLIPVLSGIGGLAAGFAGGWGLGSRRQ